MHDRVAGGSRALGRSLRYVYLPTGGDEATAPQRGGMREHRGGGSGGTLVGVGVGVGVLLVPSFGVVFVVLFFTCVMDARTISAT